MPDTNSITYICSKCGYTNIWTRDEIVQRGAEVVYRGEQEELFSLPCKNPQLACPERTRVAVPIKHP